MIDYLEALPSQDFLRTKLNGRKPILLYDEVLLKFPKLADWITQFDKRVTLSSGEELKKIEHWPEFLKTFVPQVKGLSAKDILLISLGGGSVTDFVGFLASVLKRGVSLWHTPSTWLAAIDSAHGGKTAMNIDVFKNQIGTFYMPERVFICRQILETQPEALKKSAYGELVKMAILKGGELFARANTDSLWELLPLAVEAKMNVVQEDPHEKHGLRQILNLGHTLGHALELNHDLPHGEAVLMGLDFAITWSERRKLLSQSEAASLKGLVKKYPLEKVKLNRAKIREAILHDKKISPGEKVNFVFIEAAGRPKVELVTVDELVEEAVNQGWAT